MSMMTIMVLVANLDREDHDPAAVVWTVQHGLAHLPIEACWLGLDVPWNEWQVAVN